FLLALLLRGGRSEAEHLRLLAEQGLAGARAEAETTRHHLAASERAVTARVEALGGGLRDALAGMNLSLVREQGEARALLEAKLREIAESSALRLAEIQRTVNEQLHQAVEKQMT